jgi:7-methyl-GTP pyrophosphatase
MNPKILLASSSLYRRMLLDRLGIPYECHSPDIDESPIAGESALSLSRRLAESKALALVSRYPEHWIIGSDQVAARGNDLLAKPGTAETARRQLEASAGSEVCFFTSVTLVNAASGAVATETDITRARFRKLTATEITDYVEREQPLDCAGSFKVEGLGISLFEHIENRDPTALIGLPLIRLSALLRAWGYPILANH